jgi:hypothetical protein
MLIYAPVKLKILRKTGESDEINLAIASGFFWQHDNDFYLITNWHNVTGWDPVNDRSMSNLGAQPTHLEMPLLLKAEATADNRSMAVRKRYSVSLYETNGTPKWIEHAAFGKQVDVVALKIAQLDDTLVSRPTL